MEGQEHGFPRLAIAEPEDRPDEEASRLGATGDGRAEIGNALLRGAEILLDMLAWWPEALLAGRTCLAALQVKQGDERE